MFFADFSRIKKYGNMDIYFKSKSNIFLHLFEVKILKPETQLNWRKGQNLSNLSFFDPFKIKSDIEETNSKNA